jgi:hypothetical protein
VPVALAKHSVRKEGAGATQRSSIAKDKGIAVGERGASRIATLLSHTAL